MNLDLEKINVLPAPTWNRLGINFTSLAAELPEFSPYRGEPLSALPEGVSVTRKPLPAPETGMGQAAADFVRQNANYRVSLCAAPGVKAGTPVFLNFILDEANPALADAVEISAGEGSELTVVMSYRSAPDFSGFHGGLVTLCAAPGAVIHLMQIQLLGDGCSHFDNVGAAADENAGIDILQAELGGGKVFSGVKTKLAGAHSSLSMDTIYFGDRSRSIDINYLAEHLGRKTKSGIRVSGALLGESQKTFRGTIDFKRGAKRAAGRESEFNLLFSPKARCRTAPLILCEEEDVDGQHAASTGRIDAQRLFYLMSRGLSEADAKKLLIEAQFRPVTDRIPEETLRAEVTDYLKERLTQF